MNKPNILDELPKLFDNIFTPQMVIDELDRIKDKKNKGSRHASIKIKNKTVYKGLKKNTN